MGQPQAFCFNSSGDGLISGLTRRFIRLIFLNAIIGYFGASGTIVARSGDGDGAIHCDGDGAIDCAIVCVTDGAIVLGLSIASDGILFRIGLTTYTGFFLGFHH